jgi:hypothetical protein
MLGVRVNPSCCCASANVDIEDAAIILLRSVRFAMLKDMFYLLINIYVVSFFFQHSLFYDA